MKKVQKGAPGYLDYKKESRDHKDHRIFRHCCRCVYPRYSQTGTRLNLLTVVAILGCLPAGKALVGVIARFPYRSIEKERADEIAGKTAHLTVCYDMVITSEEKNHARRLHRYLRQQYLRLHT